jgi:hypothetical protein
MQQSYDTLIEKWAPVLNEGVAIKDHHRRQVTAAILENQERAMSEERSAMHGFLTENAAAPGNSTGSVSNFDPVLISLVRRSMPNLLAYDVCGVQPMNGPTGLIFAMKARYGSGSTSSSEALFSEAETRFSGDSGGTHDSDNASGFNGVDSQGARLTALAAGGMPTADAEALGATGGSPFNKMGFTIEKQTVTAKSRALQAEYSLELAQDLKAIHGLDAETELANILSTEILAEINREVIRTINSQAKTGAQQSSVAAKGIFDVETDTDGRWSAEKFKGLGVQIDREANVIAKETRRGKGNIVICSSDVATALAAAGTLDYSPAINNNLQVDDTGNTFAGLLNGRIKVYIDPYASTDYMTVGYKGTNPYDAGVFYCPYVPLQMVKAVSESTFAPKIGFKTRYGMTSNPFVGATPANGLATVKTNQYYRIMKVQDIMV